jgi:hypothetical protein
MGVKELWQRYYEHHALLNRAKEFAIHPSELHANSREPSAKAANTFALKLASSKE